MRKPTHADAELLLHLYEIRREPELRQARAWFLTEFKPSGWAEIKARYLTHADEDRHFRMTVSYWEMVGTLVNRGVRITPSRPRPMKRSSLSLRSAIRPRVSRSRTWLVC